MKKINFKNIKGYIEGYYGKLLSWNDRIKILKTLRDNDMKFYFYCPKEDIYQRLHWRNKYNKEWAKSFNLFCNVAKKYNINVIAGISPGLDFDFESLITEKKHDLNLINDKLIFFLEHGASYTSILFDDIPNNFEKKFGLENEGVFHAKIINEISKNIKENIFAVPRIYSDELNKENPYYIKNFLKTLNKDIFIFYCGKYIVSKNFKSDFKIIKDKIKKGLIINWDNFYANDYCPKRLIIGPWKNKNLIEKSMINGTGNIFTDNLILEIINKTKNKKNKISIWKSILTNHGVPKDFFQICKYFLSPGFTFENKIKKITYNENFLLNIENLLWRWKSPLSREWYPYLLNLKHDLQILNNELTFNRILKTQTNPLQIKLKRGDN